MATKVKHKDGYIGHTTATALPGVGESDATVESAEIAEAQAGLAADVASTTEAVTSVDRPVRAATYVLTEADVAQIVAMGGYGVVGERLVGGTIRLENGRVWHAPLD